MTTEEYTKLEGEIRRKLFEVKSELATRMLSEEEYKTLKAQEKELLENYKKIALEKAITNRRGR